MRKLKEAAGFVPDDDRSHGKGGQRAHVQCIKCLESTKPRTAEKRRHDNGPVAPINSGKTMKGIDKVHLCKEKLSQRESSYRTL